MNIRIGTRRSPLALWQAGFVRDLIRAADPSCRITLVPVTTTADRLEGPLAEQGGKGLFVKELEEALLAGRIDCAVHSCKDLPGLLPPGLGIVATVRREDPRDVAIVREGAAGAGSGLAAIPRGALVRSGSLRRRYQLLARRPDCRVEGVRGNVDTRVRKLLAGDGDALLLAMAGLTRLGLTPPAVYPLEPDDMLPAIGQGAIAIEGRVADRELVAFIRAAAHHQETGISVCAERAVQAAVGGDCFTPLAAHVTRDGESLRLTAWLATPDGARAVDMTRSATIQAGDEDGAEQFGLRIGRELRAAL